MAIGFVQMTKGKKMRLIDADALIQDLKDHKIPFNADINDAIIVAPTIDAVPVKHGHWECIPLWKHEHSEYIPAIYFRCSACYYPALSAPNYCPNCGAKMDGVKEDAK